MISYRIENGINVAVYERLPGELEALERRADQRHRQHAEARATVHQVADHYVPSKSYEYQRTALSEVLIGMMRDAKVTIDRLADLTDIPVSRIASWRKGRGTLPTDLQCRQLAVAMRSTPNELLNAKAIARGEHRGVVGLEHCK